MIPLSKKYLPQITAGLLLTLIPVVLHSYLNIRNEDCVPAPEMFELCNGTIADESADRRLKTLFGEIEWCSGILPEQDDLPPLNYWILRSYDPKKLYHLPETGFVRGAAPYKRATERLNGNYGPVPVHRAYYHSGDMDIYVAYMLIYNSEPIGNPYIAQILSVPRQLLTGTAPMNLIFVTGRGPHGTLAKMEEQGNRWLLEVLVQYQSLCQNHAASPMH